MEEVKYRGYTIAYAQDEGDESPREMQDNLGIMAFFHKRYTLGDSTGMSTSEFEGWNDMKSHIARKLKGVLITPVYMYDHSNISFSVDGNSYPYNDRWDAGQIGFIYTTKEKIREWYGKKSISKKSMDRAMKMLLHEVEEYNQYFSGDVYYLQIRNEHDVIIDSLGGIYGSESVLKEGKNMVDCLKDGPKMGNRSLDRQKKAQKQLRDSSGRFIKKVS